MVKYETIDCKVSFDIESDETLFREYEGLKIRSNFPSLMAISLVLVKSVTVLNGFCLRILTDCYNAEDKVQLQ